MAKDAQYVKDELCKSLQVIDSGRFATSGPLPMACNPGLSVHGLGRVGLPLSGRDAAELARASHEAPFGKGTETFVDPSVRKTWELNPSQFELCNPAWQSTLQEAIDKATKELGVINGATSIHAELHKLLLYEPGAFFDKHRDTEKAPGMFATLVIALPSQHTGGDVMVQLKDESQTLQTQGHCDFGYSYLAWYADVNHSVSKVESGHRLVLTYNLMQHSSELDHIPSILDDHTQNLENTLALWDTQIDDEIDEAKSGDPTWQELVFILDHQYSEANISIGNLKGKDQLRVRYLSDACRNRGFCLLLAHLQFSKFGSVDGDEDDPSWAARANVYEFLDELESTWKLRTLYQSDGEQLAKDITLEDDEEIINCPDLADIVPDEVECDGWTGNEGCTATHFYHQTCAVILPVKNRLEFLTEAPTLNAETYIATLLEEIQRSENSTNASEELKKLCEMIIDAKQCPEKPQAEQRETPDNLYYRYNPCPWLKEKPEIKPLSHVSDEGLGSVIQAALTLEMPDIVEAVAVLTSRTLPSHVFYKLGEHLAANQTTPSPCWLKSAVSRSPHLAERVEALEHFMDGFRAATSEQGAAVGEPGLELAESLIDTHEGTLNVTFADAIPMLALSMTYGHTFTTQKLLPLVKTNIEKLDFVILFLGELAFSAQAQKLAYQARKPLYQEIFTSLLATIPNRIQLVDTVQSDVDNSKRPRLYYEDYRKAKRQQAEDPASKPVTPDQLAKLFHQCEKLDLTQEVSALSDTIAEAASIAKSETFETVFLPLLHKLPPSQTTPSKEQYAPLFSTILTAYIKASNPPTQCNHLMEWTCLPRNCTNDTCPDCSELNAFLTSPDLPRAEFHMVSHHRKHVEVRLKASKCKF